MKIDPVAFGNFIFCPFKAFLKSTGVVGEIHRFRDHSEGIGRQVQT